MILCMCNVFIIQVVILLLKSSGDFLWLLLKQELSIKTICSVSTQEGFFFFCLFFFLSWGHSWHNWMCWKLRSGNSWKIRPAFLTYLPAPQLKCWKYTLLDAINVMIHFSYHKLKSITSSNVSGVFLAFFNLWKHILWEHKVIAKYPFRILNSVLNWILTKDTALLHTLERYIYSNIKSISCKHYQNNNDAREK